jgi:hypothetical protein
MPNNDDNLLERVREYWEGGQPLAARQLIHDNLPADARPAWATRILRLVLDRSGVDRSHCERNRNDLRSGEGEGQTHK